MDQYTGQVLVETPASPTSWEKSLGEGTESREDTAEIPTQRVTSSPAGHGLPLPPSSSHTSPQATQGKGRCPRDGAGVGQLAHGPQRCAPTRAELCLLPGLAVMVAPTLEPRSLKMISTSRIFPNCCKWREQSERLQSSWATSTGHILVSISAIVPPATHSLPEPREVTSKLMSPQCSKS